MVEAAGMASGGRWPNPGARYVALVLALLLLDQAIKLAAHMLVGPYRPVGELGPLAVTLELHDGTGLGRLLPEWLDRYVRIGIHLALATGLFLLLVHWRRHGGSRLLLVGLAICVAGELGNLVDRVFHGVLFNEVLPGHAARWFHGRLTDVFRLTLFPVRIPAGLPHGGALVIPRFAFNLADLMVAGGGITARVALARRRRDGAHA